MTDTLALRLFLLLAAVPLVVAVHELGHVIGGRVGGYYVAAAGIGSGRRFLTLPLTRRFNLFFGPLPLAGGATIAFPTRLPMGRASAFIYHYGGILGQLVLQAAVHLVYWKMPDLRPTLLPGIALNAAVIAANLLPYRVQVRGVAIASDGARAMAAIAAGRGSPPAPQGGMGTEGFDAVEARLGTPVGRFVLGICRALSLRGRSSDTFLRTAPEPAGVPDLYRSMLRQEREKAAQAAPGEVGQPDPSTTST